MFTHKIEVCFAFVQVGKTQVSNDAVEKLQYHQINTCDIHQNWGNISASEVPICPKAFNWTHTNLVTAESNSCY